MSPQPGQEGFNRPVVQEIASRRRPPEEMAASVTPIFSTGLPTDGAVLAAEMLKLDERLTRIERGVP